MTHRATTRTGHDPSVPDVWTWADRAGRRLAAGDAVEARELAERALRVDPTHLGAAETLARACWRCGDYPAVLRAVDQLVRINPYEPGYRSLRAAALEAMGMAPEAGTLGITLARPT